MEYSTIEKQIEAISQDTSTEQDYGKSLEFDENGEIPENSPKEGIYFNANITNEKIKLLDNTDNLINSTKESLIKIHKNNKKYVTDKLNSIKIKLDNLKNNFPDEATVECSMIESQFNSIEQDISKNSLKFKSNNEIERKGLYFSDEVRDKNRMLLDAADGLLSLTKAKIVKGIHDKNKKFISTKINAAKKKLKELKQRYPDPFSQAYQDIESQLSLLNKNLCDNATEFDDNGAITRQGIYFDNNTKDTKIKLLDCINDYMELLEADCIDNENYQQKNKIKSKHSDAKRKLIDIKSVKSKRHSNPTPQLNFNNNPSLL